MRYNIKGKNISIGDRTKEKVESKLNRIEKFFPEDTLANVKIGQEGLNYTIEITIPMKKKIVRAECTTDDMISALDKSVDIIESQVVKYKNRMRSKIRTNEHHQEEYDSILVDIGTSEDEKPMNIIRSKRFEFRPMDAEEAIMQMELLGHSFFVFRDCDSDEINVVYKRKDGAFGLIAPEY